MILAGVDQPTKQAYRGNSAIEAAPAAQPSATPTPAPSARSTPKFEAYGGYDPDPCYHAEDKDAADLCAQWRAALAAEKAAHESRRATDWAIVATLFSFAGLCGLIWTILQTKGSLGEARRSNRITLLIEKRARRESRNAEGETKEALRLATINADAAAAHVRVAEQASRAQLRPYIYATKFEFDQNPPDPDVARIWVTIKNFGSTPARDCRFQIGACYGPYPLHEQLPDIPPFDRPGSDMAPTQEVYFPALAVDFTKYAPLVAAGQKSLIVIGTISYKDFFGKEYLTNFCQYCHGTWLHEQIMEAHPRGNNST